MEKNYYTDLVVQLNDLIKEEKYNDALAKIQEELNMPYVPKDTEIELQNMQIMIKSKLSEGMQIPANGVLTQEDIKKILKSPMDEQLEIIAIDQLKNLNIRSFLPELKSYLNNPIASDMNKTLIIFTLANQQIDEELTFIKSGQSLTLNPKDVDLKKEQDQLFATDKVIENAIYHNNPSIYNLANVVLNSYFYSMFPNFLQNKQTINDVAAAILYYASTLVGENITENDLKNMVIYENDCVKEVIDNITKFNII